MKKLPLLLLLFAPFLASAQTVTGIINSAGSTCVSTTMYSPLNGPANCVSVQLPPNAGSVSFVLADTFSATVQFELSADNGNTWVSAATASSTSAGTTTVSVAAYTHARARGSAYTSGAATTTITASTAVLGGPATAHAISALLACADTSSSATTYTCTTSPSFTPAAGDALIFSGINQNNSGSSTLNVNTAGAKTLKKQQNAANLASGDLQAAGAVVVVYDGTNWQIVGQIGNAGGGLPTGLTYVAPTLTVSSAGNGNGALALSGNTSGVATFTAPAVAGTATNPIVVSNAIQLPSGGHPAITFSGESTTGFDDGSSFQSTSIGVRLSNVVVGLMALTGWELRATIPFCWDSQTSGNVSGTCDTGLSRDAAGIVDVGTGSNGSTTGKVKATAIATVTVLTTNLPTCTANTGVPWRASVSDATAPALGVALTGGGLIFANVHCSLTSGTYIVDGL